MDPICKPEDVGLSSARLELIQPWIQTYLDAGKLPFSMYIGTNTYISADPNSKRKK